jgi:uncharacterized repeat protein (TIGR01451 family)
MTRAKFWVSANACWLAAILCLGCTEAPNTARRPVSPPDAERETYTAQKPAIPPEASTVPPRQETEVPDDPTPATGTSREYIDAPPADAVLPPSTDQVAYANQIDSATALPGGEGEAESTQKQSQEADLSGDDLVKIEANHPEEVAVGKEYEYELKLTNTSEDKMLHDVKLRQTLSDKFTIESSKPEREGDDDSETAEWRFSQLGPGESKSVHVKATSDSEGVANHCLAVSYTPAICLTTRFVKPDIELVKQAPKRGNLCEPVIVRYHIRNQGTGEAKEVEIRDSLPEALATEMGQEEVRIDVGNLAPGASKQVEARLLASETGQLGSRATAQVEGEEQARSNYAATEFRQAELDVAIEGPDAEYINRPMNYTIRVKNVGNATAHNGQLVVDLPEGIEVVRKGEVVVDPTVPTEQSDEEPEEAARQFGVPTPAAAVSGILQAESIEPQVQEAAENAGTRRQRGRVGEEGRAARPEADVPSTANGSLQWELGNVAPDQEAVIRFTAIGRQKGDHKFESTATFLCEAGEDEDVTTTANLTSEIIALPALLLAAVDDEDPIGLDGEVTYTVVVMNQGDADDHDVEVTAKLPEELEYLNSSGDTDGEHKEGEVRFEKIDKLSPGERATWKIVAQAKEEGDVRFSAELRSESLKQAATSEEPTRLFQADNQ